MTVVSESVELVPLHDNSSQGLERARDFRGRRPAGQGRTSSKFWFRKAYTYACPGALGISHLKGSGPARTLNLRPVSALIRPEEWEK